MKRPNANTVAALAATVTAVAALAVAVWDNVQSRAYNRLTVRPLLVLDMVRNTSGALDRGEYRVSNQGVGPAILRDLTIHYTPIGSGTELGSGGETEFEEWATLASELRALGFTVTGWTDITADRAVGVDRDVSLFTFQIERLVADSIGISVQDVLDALEVEVTYESVYGEAFYSKASSE